jgi:hypothetical protein
MRVTTEPQKFSSPPTHRPTTNNNMPSSASRFRFKRFATVVTAAPARPKILIDLGHGQSGFVDPAGKESPRLLGYRAIADRQAADLATTPEPLTAATLKGVNVLALLLPQTPFDAAAIAAVTTFVREGGALLLITDEEARAKVKLAELRLNEIVAPFGLKFTGDTPDPHNCGALAPAGPVNPVAREIPFSGGRAVEGGTGFAFTLDAAGKPTPRAQAAFATVPGGGKVIAMGDGMPMLFLGRPDGVRLKGTTREDTLYWGKDAREFMADVLGWLAKK